MNSSLANCSYAVMMAVSRIFSFFLWGVEVEKYFLEGVGVTEKILKNTSKNYLYSFFVHFV